VLRRARPPTPRASTAPTEEKHKQRRGQSAPDQHHPGNTRWQDHRSAYSPDAQFVSPAGTFTGRHEIAAFFDGWFQSFSIVEINDTTMLEDGKMLVVEAITTLKHTGPMALPDW
jgi:hypothetical protein